MVERKQIGVRAVLFLLLMTGLTYAVKRKVWAEVHIALGCAAEG